MAPLNRAQSGYGTGVHSGAFFNSTIDKVNSMSQFGPTAGPDIANYGGLNRQLLGNGAGMQPGATGVDSVLAAFTLSAGALANNGQGLMLTGKGNFGATANNKTIKLIAGATSAVVGQAVVGGTTIATTGVVATNGGGWSISAELYRVGASSQLAISTNPVAAIPALLALTDTGALTFALTGNAATATSDIVAFLLEVLGKS